MVRKFLESMAGISAVVFIGTILGKASKYAVNILIARGFGPAGLGIFSVGLILMNVASILSRGGMDTGLRKIIPKYNAIDSKSIVDYSTQFAMISGVVFSIAISSAILVFDETLLGLFSSKNINSLRYFVLGIPAFTLLTLQSGIFDGLKRPEIKALLHQVVQPLIAIIGIAIASHVYESLPISILAYIISIVLTSIVGLYILSNYVEFRVDTPKPQIIKELYSESLPLLLISAAQYLTIWTDIIVLSIFFPSKLVGTYQAAYQVSTLITLVLVAVNSIFPSIASEKYSQGNKEELQETYRHTVKWITLATAFLLTNGIIFRKELLQVFGDGFTGGSNILIVLFIGQFIASIAGPAGYLLIMSDNQKVESSNHLVVFVLNLLLNLILTPIYGPMGAAVATSISLSALNILRAFEVKRWVGINSAYHTYWRGFIGLVPVIALSVFISETTLNYILGMFVAGILSGSAYLGYLYLFEYDDSDRLLLQSVR